MTNLYTKSGRPLQCRGSDLYSASGTYLGSISGDRVYDPSGRYAGTIDGDRVVYRSTDSAALGTMSTTADVAGSASAPMAGSAIWGDEPDFPN